MTDQVVEFVRSIPDLDTWKSFVNVHSFWIDNPEIIRALEYRWLAFAIDPKVQAVGSEKFWLAVKNLNESRTDKKHLKRPSPSRSPNDLECTKESEIAESLELRRDQESPMKRKKFSCSSCDKAYVRLKELRRHHQVKHQHQGHQCQLCERIFWNRTELNNHKCLRNRDDKEICEIEGNNLDETESFTSIVRTETDVVKCSRFEPVNEIIDYDAAMVEVLPNLKTNIRKGLEKHGSIKFQLKMMMNFKRCSDENEQQRFYFSLKPKRVLESDLSSLDVVLREGCEELSNQIDQFCHNGSNWIVENLGFFDLDVLRYQPIRGSSYFPLPKEVEAKKAVINVQNTDNQCFKWSILAAIHPVSNNPHRLCNYLKYANDLDFTGIPFPVTIDRIELFEDLNNLRINVLGFRRALYPIRITKKRDNKEIIHLLLLKKGDKSHYSWIKNIERLLHSQTKHESRKNICPYCFFAFNGEEKLLVHMGYCQGGHQLIKMPVEGEKLLFKNIKNQLTIPFVIVGDFECTLVKSGQSSPVDSSTRKTHKHVVNSFAAVCVEKCGCQRDQRFTNFLLRRESDPAGEFLAYCLEHGERHQMKIDRSLPLKMTQENQVVFDSATTCSICGCGAMEFNKVRDHCHICGKFRGAAHDNCNLEFKQQRDIPVIFHNLRRYDGHLLMQAIGKIASERSLQINCVPKSMEDYLTFSLSVKHRTLSGKVIHWKLRFIDSLQFLNSSLSDLVDNLAGENFEGDDTFKALRSQFPEFADRKLLLRKGVYPYEFIDDSEKFKQESLPSQEEFYSQLKLEGIADEDYDHAKHVWDYFQCTNLGQYHDLYLTTDVLLLADVFENFRETCFTYYGLDPAHYITLPSFAWDACLKATRVQLDLLSDPDMYSFFENSIRGGISMITHRHSKANNRYLKDFDTSERSRFILYFDANNLYGWAMSQYLPIAEFQWMNEEDRRLFFFNVSCIPDDSDFGYIVEVDLDYPWALHDQHNDYPLAAESLLIRDEMLSDYSREIKTRMNLMSGNIHKLTPNLYNKRRYVVHYLNLKFYLAQGLKLVCVHRGIKFRQRPWLKPYIEFNTIQRAKSKSIFEKNFFKLLNNAVFGKSMENVRNYASVKLSSDPRKQTKWIADTRYKNHVMFNGNLMAVSMEYDTVKLCKPIYTGFTVLEISKLLMYDFHYNYIKKKFDSTSKLLFTDTDSLCYQFECEDIYSAIQCDSRLFDFSDYPKDHPLYNTENKKVIGKMKDETNGEPIVEFVGLRAKMYSMKLVGTDMKKAKGIVKPVVQKVITHEDYIDALQRKNMRKDQMIRFQNFQHEIFTVAQTKTSLCCFDDKRYILSDGVTTLAHGHYLIDGKFLE